MQGLGSIRHQAEDRDNLARFGYTANNGRSFAEHEAVDPNGFVLHSAWVRKEHTRSGRGGDWALRIQALPWTAESNQSRSDYVGAEVAPPNASVASSRVRLLVYLADECTKCKRIQAVHSTGLSDTTAVLNGRSVHAGGAWSLHVLADGPAPNAVASIATTAFHSIPEELAQQKLLMLMQSDEESKEEVALVGNRHIDARKARNNVHVMEIDLQIGASGDAVELVFVSNRKDASASDRLARLSGGNLQQLISDARRKQSDAISKVLPVNPPSREDVVVKQLQTSRDVAAASLLGGIGHFRGKQIVRNSDVEDAKECAIEETLLTCTPSRSMFPRGFLWDEGFHQLLLMQLDEQLSILALQSWLLRMRKSGWIPREQILGAEARSRVPSEFIAQEAWSANPPSLMLAFEAHALRELQEPDRSRRHFLRWAFPKLNRWLTWLRGSQAGAAPGSFLWNGRTLSEDTESDNPKTLQSGLDDYPRAESASHSERHLDLRCWMAIAYRAASNVAYAGGVSTTEARVVHAISERLNNLQNLSALHWDESSQLFADYDGENSRFVTDPVGYVNLFPLLAGMLQHDTVALQRTLDVMEDRSLLWSDYGLRSVSASSAYYQKPSSKTDSPYWRGSVWLNINYLALRELYRLLQQQHAAAASNESYTRVQALYTALRANVLNTVASKLAQNGYLYESYDDRTGEGKGTRPFAGWTALVALIASEQYT